MSNSSLSAKERKRLKYEGVRHLRKQRALLVIDNTPIRNQEISVLQKWRKKLEKLELTLQQFHRSDLQLYSEWHQLTFRQLLEKLEKTRADFQRIAEYHNKVVFISKQNRISVPEAYHLLKEEQRQHEKGDAAVRAKIEAVWSQREQELTRILRGDVEDDCPCAECRRERAARQKIHDEDATDEFTFSADDDEVDFGTNVDRDQARQEFASEIKRYEQMSNEQLRKIMRDTDRGFYFVLEAINLLVQVERRDLLLKIWEAAPAKVKKMVDSYGRKNVGQSFSELMSSLEFFEEISDEDENDDSEESDFESEYFSGTASGRHRRKELIEDEQLQLKSTYRKIVRKIHPDYANLIPGKVSKEWLETVWTRSTEAHNKNDQEGLTGIYYEILAVFGEFGELGLHDLRQAAQSFEREHKRMLSASADIKRNPAWNFSKLKDYGKLEKKVASPLLRQLTEIETELNELKTLHQALEVMKRKAPASRRPKKSVRRLRKVRGVHRREPFQASFFDRSE